MEKFKKNLVILSLLDVMIALYASECWEAVYFRKNGFEHPLENLVSLCILMAFIAILIFIAVVSRRKKEEKHQKYALCGCGRAGRRSADGASVSPQCPAGEPEEQGEHPLNHCRQRRHRENHLGGRDADGAGRGRD